MASTGPQLQELQDAADALGVTLRDLPQAPDGLPGRRPIVDLPAQQSVLDAAVARVSAAVAALG